MVNEGGTWIEYDGMSGARHGSPASNVYYAYSIGSQITFGVTLEDPHDHHGEGGAEVRVRVYPQSNGVVSWDDYSDIKVHHCAS